LFLFFKTNKRFARKDLICNYISYNFIILSKQATKNPFVNVSSGEARKHARVLSVCPRLGH